MSSGDRSNALRPAVVVLAVIGATAFAAVAGMVLRHGPVMAGIGC